MAAGIENNGGVVYAVGNPYYDNLLTNYFLTNLPDALNKSTVLVDKIQKVPKEAVSGRYILWPVLTGRNTGHSNVGYGSAIPDPGARTMASAGTLTRKQMARIALDGDTIRHGKKNGGAYAEALGVEMESILTSMALDRARQVHNDGSGRIAEVSVLQVGGATSMTLKINSSIEGASTTRASGTLENYLEVGMRIAFCSSGGTVRTPTGTSQTGFYITAVTVSGSNVLIDFANLPSGGTTVTGTALGANVTVGDWVVTAATDTATNNDTGLRHEILGIGGIFSDIGTNDGIGLTANSANAQQSMVAYAVAGAASPTAQFQGVTCSTNTWNQGIVLDNSGAGNRPLSESLLQQTISDAERINGANVEMILSHPFTYDSYVALTVPDKRYVNTTELKGGTTSISFNGMPWVKDRHCYQNRAYFLALDQLKFVVTQELTALQVEDLHVWERLPNLDRYWRGWVREDQLIVEGIRNRCGAVLTELNS